MTEQKQEGTGARAVRISAYETTDGKVFKDRAEARKHQEELDFVAWYNHPEGPARLSAGECFVSGADLREWLVANADRVRQFLRIVAGKG